MTAAEQLLALGVEDVQAGSDDRGVSIDEVGVDELAYPVTVRERGGSVQSTVAELAMTVELAHNRRGVHMSRFVEVLDACARDVSPLGFQEMLTTTRLRLQSERSQITMRFPYFLTREAPESGISAMTKYDCLLSGRSSAAMTSIEVGVRVPVTSLCPCSKEISDYGAHNQRGYVEIAVTSPWVDGSAPRIWFDDLIEVAEAAASAPVYPLLKRSDERFVTMQAYDNPAFVEDIVRDVLVSLKRDRRVARARVRVSNQESIHDHNAVARLQWERTGG